LALSNETGLIAGRKDNTIKLEVTDIPFKLTAKGFDRNRDLKIRLVRED